MAYLNIRRIGATAVAAVALTVCGRAATPDASPAPAPAPRTPAQNSASLFPALPDDGAESRLSRDRFDFIRRDSSVGGVVGGASSSALAEPPSARLMEQLERRRNWIYSTQTPSSFELSAQEVLGVRSSEPSKRSGESGGMLADFFHDRSSARPQNRSIDDPLSRSMQVPGVDNKLLGNMTSGLGLVGHHGSLGMEPFRSAGTEDSTPSSTRAGVIGELGLSEEGVSGGPASIRELLSTPGTVNPLVAGFDPINMRVDSTRQELNPTTTDPLAGFITPPKTIDAILDTPTRAASSGRPSALDNFNTRMLGNSSLAPAIAPFSEARPADRPLDFGQFPSRKF
jgi:hypothetical protein